MYRCRCCLYRTGGVLSRGVGADSQIFHLAMPAPARVGIPTGGRVPTHPSRARASVSFISESRGATLHVDLLRSFATTCYGWWAFGPLSVAPLFMRLWGSCAGFGVGRKRLPSGKRASYSSTRTTSRDMRRNELARRVRTPGFWPLPERRLFTPTFSHRTKHI